MKKAFRIAAFTAAVTMGVSVLGLVASGARALAADPVRIGVTVSSTGPAASLGIPETNAVALLAREVAGHPVEYIVLDDATDTTRGVANMRKFISEEKVDAVVGSSVTPVTLAMVEVGAESQTPVISLAANARIVEPIDEKKKWAFKTPQNDRLMAKGIAGHMADNGVKSVGFIGFTDAYGEGWLEEMKPALEAKGIKLVAVERYNRPDTSVTGQILKILSAKPDAVMVGGAGTPAALPARTLKERGFRGLVYQTHGAANNDFLRVGGKDVEGSVLPAGPVLVADQLPDDHPSKPVAQKFIADYEGKYGKGSMSTFAAHMYDAGLLLQAAIPEALKKAKPGTPEFRVALRDALENARDVVYTQGVVNMSPSDHVGQDDSARVMVEIRDGGWKLLPEKN